MTTRRRAEVGPNAVTRVVEALGQAGLEGATLPIFAAAGVREWLDAPPTEMVDERGVARLHRAARDALPPDRATEILADAGRRTAEYLLANRIPLWFQRSLPWAPTAWRQRLLLAAIGRHAWTFAGSGRFSWRVGHPTLLEIRDNPFCAGERRAGPVCDWHAAVFQTLFGVLVRPAARVREVACAARGDECCRFALTWPSPRPLPEAALAIGAMARRNGRRRGWGVSGGGGNRGSSHS